MMWWRWVLMAAGVYSVCVVPLAVAVSLQLKRRSKRDRRSVDTPLSRMTRSGPMARSEQDLAS